MHYVMQIVYYLLTVKHASEFNSKRFKIYELNVGKSLSFQWKISSDRVVHNSFIRVSIGKNKKIKTFE